MRVKTLEEAKRAIEIFLNTGMEELHLDLSRLDMNTVYRLLLWVYKLPNAKLTTQTIMLGKIEIDIQQDPCRRVVEVGDSEITVDLCGYVVDLYKYGEGDKKYNLSSWI